MEESKKSARFLVPSEKSIKMVTLRAVKQYRKYNTEEDCENYLTARRQYKSILNEKKLLPCRAYKQTTDQLS